MESSFSQVARPQPATLLKLYLRCLTVSQTKFFGIQSGYRQNHKPVSGLAAKKKLMTFFYFSVIAQSICCKQEKKDEFINLSVQVNHFARFQDVENSKILPRTYLNKLPTFKNRTGQMTYGLGIGFTIFENTFEELYHISINFNLFVPNTLFSNFPSGFLMFQGLEKGCIGNKWVKSSG